jgi:hypothetical protein
MKKQYLFASLILFCCASFASGQTITRRMRSGASLPATCQQNTQVVDVFVLLSGVPTNDGEYWCNAGTWVKDGAGGVGGGSPGGLDTYVQFNDGGTFGGDAGLIYNKTTDRLTTGGLSVSSLSGVLFATSSPFVGGVGAEARLALVRGGTNANLSATGGTSQVLKQVSTGAAVTVGQLACNDLSDVGGGCTSNAFNLTANTYLLTTAPAAPPAGQLVVWMDDGDFLLKAKDEFGGVSLTVRPEPGAANNFLTAISSTGVPQKARPSCADLSDAATGCSSSFTSPQFTTGIGIGVAATTGNSIKAVEAAAPSGMASNDLLYPDSTAHRWKVNNNNGGATTLAVFTDKLNVFAATTSAEFAGVISDETGTGKVVLDTSPQFTTSAISPLFRSTVAKVLFQGTGTGATQLAATQTTAPTCTTNCGTGSPTVAGTDTWMTVTLGNSPASGFVINFNGTWAAAPSCICHMATAGMVVGKQPLTIATTTTTITVVTNGTAPASGDKYHIHCGGTQ